MTDADYSVAFEGVEFGPIPRSWLNHPNAYDRDRRGGPRLLAVSAAAYRPKTLRVRYAHPRTGQILVCQTAGHEGDDGTVPRALVNGSGWPRSLRPGRSDPMDVLRVAEEQHLEGLWADRVELPVGQQRERAVADGGDAGAK